MKEPRVLLVGGGSGGHVYPLIAVARALKEKATTSGINLKLMMIGDGSFLERAARENNISFKKITASKLRRYPNLEFIIDIFKIPISFAQSFWYLFLFMPNVVFTKGGATSVMPATVAKLFFIPVFIHESDSVPGLANRFIGKFAKKIFISFKGSAKYFKNSKTIFTGNPVRKELSQGDKNTAVQYFSFSGQRPTVLVLGGSQGAKIINEVVLAGFLALTQKLNVIHQCGDGQYYLVKTEADKMAAENYRLYPFLDENQLALAYALADVIVSRAGAGLLFEIAQIGKPAIIVPILNSSANHQYLNAAEFSSYGARLIEEPSFNQNSLIRTIENILNPDIYIKISDSIKRFATSDAADRIAQELVSSIK
ncbi:MAG: UDP-N-acetylglucosamine--N-acetylmuramyl-(pentapeptide) pyrophosphoryl-undecaprenol N-acetylglucosamine transferase [bacterium]|nr:UDP-N-acetylglucosamine--N-acetylmuramyl-(pentapeptide) pyrophosphoryl-undecaprenol N-acetylglucosamine transferase [bacterium]